MKIIKLHLLICVIILPSVLLAQKKSISPEWDQPVKVVRGNEAPALAPSFVNAKYPGLPDDLLPVYVEKITMPKGTQSVSITIDAIEYMSLTEEEQYLLTDQAIPSSPEAAVSLMHENGNPVAVVKVKPFGINPVTGENAKLKQFQYTISTSSSDSGDSTKLMNHYAKNSRLSYGEWFKLWVRESGIHKLTYDQMREMGIQVDGINPDNIQMFGNGGRMLNEVAGNGEFDDLSQISIRVVTAAPGVFQSGDYILFYGEGPVTWKYNPTTGLFRHSTHLYTDVIGYFITIANHPGKRIPVADSDPGASNKTTDKYTALAVYEQENLSLIKSGRKWFSAKLDQYSRSITLPDFNFPDIDTKTSVNIAFGLAGRATQQMSFDVVVNNININNTTIAKYTSDNDFARDTDVFDTFKANSGDMRITVQFNPPNSSALGWFDYVALNVRSHLRFHDSQLRFRDPLTVGEGNVTNFNIETSGENIEIWDITKHTYAYQVPVTKNGNNYSMKVSTPYLREFIAFDGSNFLTPEFAGKVPNQNLHGTKNYEMIIVSHPTLLSEANRLADLHNRKGDVTVKVVNLPDIYNEFSSGHPDITAIRDFMKLIYDKGYEHGYPRYLLLFGNASYDYKNRIMNNANLVPTYQSYNSVKPTVTFLTDDYFGLLDNGEGGGSQEVNGLLDIGIGRLPVRSLSQATDVVNKIEAYLMNDSLTHGDWRNNIIVIADDEDNNTHLQQAERLCSIIDSDYPLYNVNKIYFDAYAQNNTPGGGRYPDVNRELNSHVDKGALITNYIGHGGELGWADERVLEIADITAWKNFNRMGLFFTATCEFSRFDDPSHVSAGELVFLNPLGGAVGMITTTRLAYASTNETLNDSFMDTALITAGRIPRMGDLIKYTKNDNSVSPNLRHLTLFGDPSLELPHAKYNVVTTSIVDPSNMQAADTLSANGKYTVHGEIHDLNDQIMNGFNGDISVKVFDKISTVQTLGQDLKSIVTEFEVRKNIIYQGKARVTNGIFNFTFPVPKDIDYNFGEGKISYYASDGYNDAHGYYTDFIIGGSKSTGQVDDKGPDITLFINDTSFVDGGLTNENPKLVVNLFDESGINIVGNGVGHDLVAILDENSYNSSPLNDFFISDRNSYQSGMARYQYFNLEDGPHSITVKAWDVFNNSSQAVINFVVKHDIRLDIDDVVAYPNPSRGEVEFRFKHNLFDEILNIEIEIYNSTGTLVRLLQAGKVTAQGYIVNKLVWDGLSSDGSILRNGLYICRVKVIDRNGNSSAHAVKVVMAK